jgi:pimeloyl-ACP methyl ester carboxylesterase
MQLDSVTLHYESSGSGPTLVCLHGLGMSSALWVSQVASLSPTHRLVLPDLRGFGRSTRPRQPGGYAMSLLAADVIALIRAVEKGPVHLLGTSMGGFVAQEIALAAPEICRSLVLCHTACRMSIPDDVLALRIRALREEPMADYGRLVASQALAPDAPPSLREWLVDMVARNDRDAYTRVLVEGLSQFDASARVSSICLPTLVVVGELDRVIPPEQGRELARLIPGARLVSIAGTGHLSYAERPDVFNETLLNFLSSLPSVPTPTS